MLIPESSIRPFEPLGLPILDQFLSYDGLEFRIRNLISNIHGASIENTIIGIENLARNHGLHNPECSFYKDRDISPGETGEFRQFYTLRFTRNEVFRTIRTTVPMRIRR